MTSSDATAASASTGPPNPFGADPAAALAEFFAAHQGELLGTLYFLVGNAEDAHDALQEAFMKCWRTRDKLAGVDNVRAWIFRVALNTGRDMRSSAWRRKRTPLDGSELPMQATETPVHEAVVQSEELQRLRNAVGQLRGEEQEVFLLRQNGAMTYEQIGEALGLATGTVKTRMRLAIAKLRAALAE
ncbi:MAG: RNA polymerase sigma factor [Planctomycetales bacterium]|nr:RNA polymerase sigma factor [Planctomycetales bacterium]